MGLARSAFQFGEANPLQSVVTLLTPTVTLSAHFRELRTCASVLREIPVDQMHCVVDDLPVFGEDRVGDHVSS